MRDLHLRNQKIIEAIKERAARVCPESLALIGIYGSFATGDFHEQSDLDLLVLINDDRGWQLGCTFIQEDWDIGHDIYCTTWDNLQEDALYNSPHISKLMDSRIVYCADSKYSDRLTKLRNGVKERLRLPLTREDYAKAENMMKEAEHFWLLTTLAGNLAEIRAQAGNVVYYVENAIAMLNKKYFHYGTRRACEELEQMERKPEGLKEMMENIMGADCAEKLIHSLAVLIRETTRVFLKAEAETRRSRIPATADALRGTYEEMFSNWRNKMYAACDGSDRDLAFMSMGSLQAMFSEVGEETEIADYNVFEVYNPHDLAETARAFDGILDRYLLEYRKVGLPVRRYPDIDAFAADYTGS